ncbi:MAG: ABC transporter ATP-binding protein [Vicinamibacterales bacterium]
MSGSSARATPPSVRTIARVLGPDVWALKASFARAYAVTLVGVAAGVVAPWIVKLVVDFLVRQSSGDPARPIDGWWTRLTGGAGASSPEAIVLGLGLAFLTVSLVGALAEAGDGLLTARIKEQLGVRLRDRMLGHLQSLPPTVRTTHRSGELVLRLVGDVDNVVRLNTKTLPLLTRHSATGLFTLIGLVWLSPRVGLSCALALPVLGLLVRYHGRRVGEATRRKRRREGEVSALAQEIVRGLPVIQALGATSLVRERFAQVSRDSLQSGVVAARATARLECTFEVARALAIGSVTVGGALSVLRGHLSVGELTLLAAYVTNLLRPIDKVNDLIEATSRGLIAGERIVKFLEQVPLVVDAPDALVLTRATGRLTLDDVWFTYPGEAERRPPVLRGASLVLEPGTLTVIVGPSGAGKSTLFSLLVRIFDPTRGTISLDGRPLPSIAVESLRAQFAVMCQDLHLFSGTLREAVTMGAGTVDVDRVWGALADVAMDAFVRSLPRGLETALGEDGLNLSGGQRQRLSLARAILLERPVLLLDEPLANVDAESARVIREALRRLRRSCTCVAITHEASLVSEADAVFRLEGGELVADSGRRSVLEVVR